MKSPIRPNVTEAAWYRLAAELRAARIRKGYRLRSHLVKHLLDNDLAKPSIDRILGDLERGARTNYAPSTLSAVEVWYGLNAGDISRILGGASYEELRQFDQARQAANPKARLAAIGWDLDGLELMKATELTLLMQAVLDELMTR